MGTIGFIFDGCSKPNFSATSSVVSPASFAVAITVECCPDK